MADGDKEYLSGEQYSGCNVGRPTITWIDDLVESTATEWMPAAQCRLLWRKGLAAWLNRWIHSSILINESTEESLNSTAAPTVNILTP